MARNRNLRPAAAAPEQTQVNPVLSPLAALRAQADAINANADTLQSEFREMHGIVAGAKKEGYARATIICAKLGANWNSLSALRKAGKPGEVSESEQLIRSMQNALDPDSSPAIRAVWSKVLKHMVCASTETNAAAARNVTGMVPSRKFEDGGSQQASLDWLTKRVSGKRIPNDPELRTLYAEALAAVDKCDPMVILGRKLNALQTAGRTFRSQMMLLDLIKPTFETCVPDNVRGTHFVRACDVAHSALVEYVKDNDDATTADGLRDFVLGAVSQEMGTKFGAVERISEPTTIVDLVEKLAKMVGSLKLTTAGADTDSLHMLADATWSNIRQYFPSTPAPRGYRAAVKRGTSQAAQSAPTTPTVTAPTQAPARAPAPVQQPASTATQAAPVPTAAGIRQSARRRGNVDTSKLAASASN